MREERFADGGVRRSDATQGEEEHEVDVGGEVAGGVCRVTNEFEKIVDIKVNLNNLKRYRDGGLGSRGTYF